MAKYFSSPSKTTHSMYSKDEVYYLLGENDSMKRLISEVTISITFALLFKAKWCTFSLLLFLLAYIAYTPQSRGTCSSKAHSILCLSTFCVISQTHVWFNFLLMSAHSPVFLFARTTVHVWMIARSKTKVHLTLVCTWQTHPSMLTVYFGPVHVS